MIDWQPAVYIMANKPHGVLYTGVTSDLLKRIFQHKESIADGFTKKYQCKKLVYYEQFEDILSAITREKQIKSGSRKKKIIMIENFNPEWHDLYETLI